MHASGILGLIIGGLIIGGLGRLVLPGRHPIGFLMTILIGVVGAAFGYYLGHTVGNFSAWPTFAVQVLLAAALVAVFAGLSRSSRPHM
jgi:uncharacterized membrane protein YeaQ/YmgE (transglycosylase-associated protein family)